MVCFEDLSLPGFCQASDLLQRLLQGFKKSVSLQVSGCFLVDSREEQHLSRLCLGDYVIKKDSEASEAPKAPELSSQCCGCSRPKAKLQTVQTVPASLAEKLPKTQVLGYRGRHSLAPQASRQGL